MCIFNDKVYLVSDEEHENHILQLKFKPKKKKLNILPTDKKKRRKSISN